jgi:hypothetical protein
LVLEHAALERRLVTPQIAGDIEDLLRSISVASRLRATVSRVACCWTSFSNCSAASLERESSTLARSPALTRRALMVTMLVKAARFSSASDRFRFASCISANAVSTSRISRLVLSASCSSAIA